MLKYDNSDTKKKLTAIAIWFAISLLIILVIINIDPINSFLLKIIDITAPVIIGAAIAYMLNPVLKFLEFVVFKNLKNKKLVRGLSLVLTYVYAISLIVLLVSVIAPQLVESIIDIGKNYNTYLDTAINVVNNIMSKVSSSFEGVDIDYVKQRILELFNESENLVQNIVSYAISYGSTDRKSVV